MISRIHESLSHTSDYIEMAGGFFASEKTAGVEAGSLIVSYLPELEKIPDSAQVTRRRDHARGF
jgi:hypothetical protein